MAITKTPAKTKSSTKLVRVMTPTTITKTSVPLKGANNTSISTSPKVATNASAAAKVSSQSTTAPKPKILVLDSFQKKTSDVDGDGIGDVSHGEFVARLITAKTGTNFNIDKIEVPDDPTVLFKSVAARIRKGEAIAGINFSQSMGVPKVDANGNPIKKPNGDLDIIEPTPENIAAATYPNDKAKQQKLISNGYNGGYSATEQRDIKAVVEKTYTTTIPAYKEMLSEAAKRNIPVTISAGNEPNRLNAYTLFEPTISVGSLGKNGVKSGFTSRTLQSDSFTKGEVNHRKVTGGIDVTGNGKPDFLDSELSGGKSRLASVLGKSYASVQASASDYQAVAIHFSDAEKLNTRGTTAPKVDGKVFDLKKLTAMMDTESQKTGKGVTYNGVSLGQAMRNLYSTGHSHVTFNAVGTGISPSGVSVQGGRVVIDVEGTGGQNVVHSSSGTSWSAPTYLADILMSRLQSTSQ